MCGAEPLYEVPIKVHELQEALEIHHSAGNWLLCYCLYLDVFHLYAFLANYVPQEGDGGDMQHTFLPFHIELVFHEPTPSLHEEYGSLGKGNAAGYH